MTGIFDQVRLKSKLRVLEVETQGGKKWYFIQKKILWFWIRATEMIGMNYYTYIAFENYEQAADFIEDHKNRANEHRLNKEVKRTVL